MQCNLTLGDNDNFVTQCGNLLHDMAGEEHTLASGFELTNQLTQRPCCHDVEAVTRLIEDDVLRFVYERASQRHLGTLALRKTLRATVGKVVDIQLIDDCLDALIDNIRRHAIELRVVGNIFAGRKVRIQAGPMRQCSDAAASGKLIVNDIDAIDGCGAGIRLQHGVKDAQGGRLAGAVWTQ